VTGSDPSAAGSTSRVVHSDGRNLVALDRVQRRRIYQLYLLDEEDD
jgi:hypothetical protein